MMASNSSKVSHLHKSSEKLSRTIRELKVKLQDRSTQKIDKKQKGLLSYLSDWFRR
jgi:hypothetical protein